MYDESIDVLDATEVKSPLNSDDDVEVNNRPMASTQRRPSARRTKPMDLYDLSDSDTPEPERFINDLKQQRNVSNNQHI